MKKYTLFSFVIIAAIVSGCQLSPAAPAVTWYPQSVSKTIGNGSALLPVIVSFESGTDLSQASITVDPAFSPYVMIASNGTSSVARGNTYEFSVTFRLPKGTIEGTYRGSIAVLEKGEPVGDSLPVELVVDYGDVIISNRVKQLSDETLAMLESMNEDQTTIVFSQSSAELDDLAPGDIVIAGISPTTPYGFMRKIVSKSLSIGVVLSTENAPLEEIILNGTIHIDEPITTTNDPVALRLAAEKSIGLERTICFPIKDLVLYDHDGSGSTTYDQVQMDMTLCFTLGFSLDMDIAQLLDKGEVDYAKFLAYGSASADVQLAVLFEQEFLDMNIPISSIYSLARLLEMFKMLPELPSIPIPVPVGPVTLMFAITPSFGIGAQGSVFAGLETNAKIELSLELGCEYTKAGGWIPISNVRLIPSFRPPHPAAGVNVKAFVDFALGTKFMPFYPATISADVGPTLTFRKFMEFEADIFDDPWWELSSGFSVIRGFKVGVPFFNLVDWQETSPFTITEPIADAGGPFIATPAPTPVATLTPAPTTTSDPANTPQVTPATTSVPEITTAATAVPVVTPDVTTTVTTAPVATSIPVLADLLPVAITYSPSSPVEGTVVSFDSGVQNAGSVGTGSFNIAWYVDNVRIGYGGHAGVSANTTMMDGNSAFSWTAVAGSHTIKFNVDEDNGIAESNESNNARSVVVTVSSTQTSPPVVTPVPTPVPPEQSTIVVDDGDAGFALYGPASYWNRVTNASHYYGGDMYWTYVNGSTTSNYARWTPNLPETASYRVDVFVPWDNATTTSARYRINFQYSSTTAVVVQNNYYDQWVSIGTYPFGGGTAGYVELADSTGEAAGTLLKVGFDAVRWVKQ